MKNVPFFKHAAIVGLFVVFLYVLCLLWKFTMADPAVAQFHLLSLKAAFPGFAGFDGLSILLGGVLSFIYGFLASVVFHSLHNNCCASKK